MNMRRSRTIEGTTSGLMGWVASWLAGCLFTVGDYSSFIQLKQTLRNVVICRLDI
jgi:hypothetical protein